MPINIELCNYWITSDAHCYIVNRKRVVQKGENAGSEYIQPIGYFTTLEHTAQFIVQQKIRGSNAKSFKEVKTLLEKINQEIKEKLGGI